MKKSNISFSEIIFDKNIYPRFQVDRKRVDIFIENIKDGFQFEPVEVEKHPGKPGKFRILDGVHRWSAYKAIGPKSIDVIIIDLKGDNALLYSAGKAIGPKQLLEDEARETARTAYKNNPQISIAKISQSIGRSSRTVTRYLSDLKAVYEQEVDIKIYHMIQLGIPQERVSCILDIPQRSLSHRIEKLSEMTKPIKTDLTKGFSVSQIAKKYNCRESMILSIKCVNKNDIEIFKSLKWGLRTWDYWHWSSCDDRFGDDWPGRIPAQLIGHILFFFSKQGDLVIDPMGGGGVTSDTCLVFNRKCWSFDLTDNKDKRPEIEKYYWDPNNLKWPVKGKTKPDIIIFDPPYFDKKSDDYDTKSISSLSVSDYMRFLKEFCLLLNQNSKKGTRFAFINADWRNFQSTSAINESTENAILIDDYLRIIKESGWQRTHIIQAPLPSERFNAGVVAAMQKKRILGVTSRYVIISFKK
ncbi:MAG: ParB N-terminal domain-containing protein [Candidatus Magnetomorum sp.]|nr:ParB N-terminal domain-containing protein [Candidatus Magnetomorum sp.]